jgi:uncharacterized membrane protein YbjE (DUF340 family)
MNSFLSVFLIAKAIHCRIVTFPLSLQSIKSGLMFIVIACMLVGIAVGYLLRRWKIRFIHRLILTLIWLLLFLLGLEVGANNTVIQQFGKLGFEAFLLAAGGTLGSVIFAWVLWLSFRSKTAEK